MLTQKLYLNRNYDQWKGKTLYTEDEIDGYGVYICMPDANIVRGSVNSISAEFMDKNKATYAVGCTVEDYGRKMFKFIMPSEILSNDGLYEVVFSISYNSNGTENQLDRTAIQTFSVIDTIEIDDEIIKQETHYPILIQLIDEIAQYKVDTSSFPTFEDVEKLIAQSQTEVTISTIMSEIDKQGYAKKDYIASNYVSKFDSAQFAKSSDLNSYVKNTTLTATLNNYVLKEAGKGLSTNDYTNEEKEKLKNLPNRDYSQIDSDINELKDAVELIEGNITDCITKINKFHQTNIVDGLQVNVATANANEIIEINDFPYNLKKSVLLSFYCKFDFFNDILIGKGYNSYKGDWIKITNKSIIWQHYEQSIEDKISIDHNLIFSNYIMISLRIDDASKCVVTINTLNGDFTTSFQFEHEANGSPFILSKTTINDITFSVTGQDFNKKIWLFGDSYFRINNVGVVGQLMDLGFRNYLVDELNEQNSEKAYSELLKCLKFGTPKYLVWGIGMNDNLSSYQTYINLIVDICKNKDISLILMEIPTIPTENKEPINDLINSSGLRYVEVCKAVNANSEGIWYDDYLSSDGINPTELGARVIAIRMLIDIPELMQTKMETNAVQNEMTLDSTETITKSDTIIGANLLLNSSLISGTDNWNISPNISRDTTTKSPFGNNVFNFNITGLTSDRWSSIYQICENFVIGNMYTIQSAVKIEENNGIDGGVVMEVICLKADGTRVGAFTKIINTSILDTWQVVTKTFTIPEETDNIKYTICMVRNGKILVGDMKLEKGSNASDWCASLEDEV